MNKTIIAIVIIVVVVFGGYFLFRGAYQPAPSISQPSSQQQIVPQPPASKPSIQQPSPQSSAEPAPTAEKNVVTYTDAGYSPATLQIKKGEAVTFKNQSSRPMWTASAVHPTHRAYPTTGGCLGSTFDSCKGVQPSDSWSFKFDIAGTWKYHNHLNPGSMGTIVVE